MHSDKKWGLSVCTNKYLASLLAAEACSSKSYLFPIGSPVSSGADPNNFKADAIPGDRNNVSGLIPQ